MLGTVDEFPIHQVPQPIAWPGSSDRNFYDRSYFNAHDRTGDIFLISGIGYYPNLGVKDAFVSGAPRRRADRRAPVGRDRPGAVATARQPATGSTSSSRCTSYALSSRRPRAIAVDLTWNGLFDVVQRTTARAAHRQPNHVGRAAVCAARHLERVAS